MYIGYVQDGRSLISPSPRASEVERVVEEEEKTRIRENIYKREDEEKEEGETRSPPFTVVVVCETENYRDGYPSSIDHYISYPFESPVSLRQSLGGPQSHQRRNGIHQLHFH